MEKLVVLKVGEGDFSLGFSVILQIGAEGAAPTVEAVGRLPPAVDLPDCYQQWQAAYRALGLPHRLGIRPDSIKHVSWETDGQQAAQALCDRTRHWLNHPHFQPLYN
ncbi:MAG: hypothetical protein AAFZ80_09580, partial [Cyanobacteria bacterium P01_A01_bin.105]